MPTVPADLAKYIQAGATYYFNKNMNVWVDYRFNLLDENDYSSSYVGTGRSGGCGYYLPVLTSRPLCFMPQKQDFGPVFLCLLEKMCVFQKQAGFLSLMVGIL
ncbi:outer membrane protein 1a (IA;b;f), porin [Salmonella bongori]|nr:outer membrane protein 1a (IA;b;f), porin [Salmonella bongori]